MDWIDGLHVRWPSGSEQAHGRVPAGSLVTLYEDAAHSPDGSGLAIEPYRRQVDTARVATRRPSPRLVLEGIPENGARAPLQLVTTMATWCQTCRGELPQLARLRKAFPPERLALFGLPVDEDDDEAKLAAYRDEHRPAYRMLPPPARLEREAVRAIVVEQLKLDVLPATIVTDDQGQVLRALDYVPSVSEVKRWLDDTRP